MKGSIFIIWISVLTTLCSLLLPSMTFADEDLPPPPPPDDADAESTTIGIEGPDNPAAGPFLIDKKIKEGEPPEQKPVGDWIILQKSMTWGDSAAACEAVDAKLVVLPTEKDAEALVSAIEGISSKRDDIENPENFKNIEIMEFGISRRYWIGLTDQVEEGKWVWAGIGYPLDYDFWYPGQPSHTIEDPTTKAEHCGSLWNPGYYEETENTHKFNDAPCNEKYYPICYKGDLNALVPKDE